MIVLILEINPKIIHEGNKYSNVLYIHVHTLPHTHAHKKNIIITSNVLMIMRIHDCTIIYLVHITPIGITHYNAE